MTPLWTDLDQLLSVVIVLMFCGWLLRWNHKRHNRIERMRQTARKALALLRPTWTQEDD